MSQNPLGLQRAQEVAKRHEGECLSKEFETGDSYMKWRCKKGHEWDAIYIHVVCKGTWCPKCGGTQKLDGIEIAKKIAEQKGGQCRSEIYENAHALLEWECDKKHIWSASLGNVKDADSWCPQCVIWKREKMCKEICDELLGIEGEAQAKRSWLSDGKVPYRLDVLYEKLRIAVEHNGAQHYKYCPLFHKNGPQDLEKQQRRDKLVKELCDENDITLIVVPYTVKDIRDYLKKELVSLEYSISAPDECV